MIRKVRAWMLEGTGRSGDPIGDALFRMEKAGIVFCSTVIVILVTL